MAGKTMWQSDKALSLLKGNTVSGASATWVNLFTTLPANDNNTSGGTLGVEWAIDRVEIKRLSGSPRWSDIKSEGNLRYIDNQGTVSWSYSTGDPALEDATVLGIGVWDGPTSTAADYNLLYWEPFDQSRTISRDEEVIFSTGDLKVRED